MVYIPVPVTLFHKNLKSLNPEGVEAKLGISYF